MADVPRPSSLCLMQVEWPDEHLSIRISAVQETIKRARFSFFLCLLASMASFVCLWNANFSWYRGFGYDKTPMVVEKSPTENTRSYLLQNELRVWVESQAITINLLGIRIDVSDFALIDSLALYMFTYYYLLSIRRENREIGQLLRDLASDLDTLGYTAYSAIASYMVFNLNRDDDRPVSTLNPEQDESKSTIRTIRGVNKIILYIPFLVVMFTIVCDVASLFVRNRLFFSSPFRADERIWDALGYQQRIYAGVMELVAFVIAIGILLLLRRAMSYDDATRAVLDSFREHLVQKHQASPQTMEG